MRLTYFKYNRVCGSGFIIEVLKTTANVRWRQKNARKVAIGKKITNINIHWNMETKRRSAHQMNRIIPPRKLRLVNSILILIESPPLPLLSQKTFIFLYFHVGINFWFTPQWRYEEEMNAGARNLGTEKYFEAILMFLKIFKETFFGTEEFF